MLTKNDLKYYSSLLIKKEREAEKIFLAEGKKIVKEALYSNFACDIIFMTNAFKESEPELFSKIANWRIPIEIVKNNELEKLSDTVTPQGIVGQFELPDMNAEEGAGIASNLVVYLDNISDPGNAGTIIRNCDWFGVKDIIFSKNSVDVFNPKVIRSSMGSVFHVNVFKETEESNLLEKLKDNGYKLLLADTMGEDIRNFSVPEKSVAVLSNESSGPSREVVILADYKITIKGKGKAESLNVSNASTVILYELTK
jgi:RNA methyltransferase, TrmH family